MKRAGKSGISLGAEEAALVKGMLERGDRQHDIAAWFGVNAGRIAEIAVGERFSNVLPVTEGLPPQGPYVSGLTAHNTMARLKEIRAALRTAIEEVDEAIAELDEEMDSD